MAEPLKLRLADLDRITGAEPSIRLGRTMAVGDLDCDGARDDLVLGAEGPAAVYVWFDLLDAADAWPSPTQPASLTTDSADLRIDGVEDSFGVALQIGDLGGACDSLVIGAPLELLGAGTARIFHGPLPRGCEGPCTLQASVDEDVTIIGAELGQLGTALAIAGDLDQTGHDDLAVGEPGWSDGSGRVLLFSAGLGLLTGGNVLSVLDASLQIRGAALLDAQGVGAALQAADVDGDDRDELLIEGGGSVLLVHDLSAETNHNPALPPPVLDWLDLATNVLIHHGHVLGAGLPMGVHSFAQPQPALWVGQPNFLLGVGAVVGLRPDIQSRYDVSVLDAPVRIEGVALEDGNFGRWLDGSDVDADGVSDLVITSPLWSDGTGTVIDSVGPRAGRTFLFSGEAVGALFDSVCAPPPCRVIGEDEAFLEIQGRQGYEGFPAATPGEGYLGVRTETVAGRLLVASPLSDDDIAGLDAGAVAGLTLDLDGDGVLLGIDCDDFDPSVYPGAPQVCDGVLDQDCDGLIDTDERDADLDGVTGCDDCDDADPLRAPDQEERWCDGRDNDCVLDALDVPELDADGDGVWPCTGDCDDADPARYPAATELCNGIDDDCDARTDEDFDQDGDGFPDGHDPACADLPAEGLDCDDADPWRHPGASEGDGLDDADCDGAIEWDGGCACDAVHAGRGSGWLLLPLLLWARRRHRWPLPLALAPLLMGHALVLPATDDDLVIVGDAAAALPGALVVVDAPDGEHALVASRPDVGWGFVPSHGWGYVYRPAMQLPRLIDTDDRMFFGNGDAFVPLYAGFALATGDINGDGRDDLVATGPTLTAVGGRVWSWLGKGPGDCPDDTVERGGFCQGAGFRATESFNDNGFTVTVGDLDADGFDDIVTGDRSNFAWNGFSLEHHGAVRIYWGQEDFAPGTVGSAVKLPGLGERSLGTFARAEADWDCDGTPDLLMGCDASQTNGCAGSQDQLELWLMTPGERTLGGALPDQRPLISITGGSPSWDMVVAQVPDVGADGCDDVLLGFPGGDGRAVFVPITPALEWLPGGGDTATWDLDDLAEWELTGPTNGGAAAALALVRWTDPTGDWPDLLIGIPGAPSDLGHAPGRVAFLRGDTTFGGAMLPTALVTDAADVVFEGRQQDERLGTHLAVWADRDGDGLDDVVVGAQGLDHPDGGLAAGALYLLPSGPFSDADGDGVPGFDDCDDRRAACIDAATDCIDADGDHVMVCAGDCDDSDATIHPPPHAARVGVRARAVRRGGQRLRRRAAGRRARRGWRRRARLRGRLRRHTGDHRAGLRRALQRTGRRLRRCRRRGLRLRRRRLPGRRRLHRRDRGLQRRRRVRLARGAGGPGQRARRGLRRRGRAELAWRRGVFDERIGLAGEPLARGSAVATPSALNPGPRHIYCARMRSRPIVQSMLDNGFLDSEAHNPNDFVNYTVRALKILEEALKDAKKHEEIVELVATMFDNGFCGRPAQSDPSEWIMYAQTAIVDLKGL